MNLEITKDKTFQTFRDFYPMERYDLDLKFTFDLENIRQGMPIPLNLMPGFDTVGDGNKFDPDNYGVIDRIPLNFTVGGAEEWLVEYFNAIKLNSILLLMIGVRMMVILRSVTCVHVHFDISRNGLKYIVQIRQMWTNLVFTI
uniref:Uncharacterized protein n=1 Tax=Aplanochytrium stocchinoi TaxID=215587 RepID=A0A7S3UYE1_9STRA|mmetsp:Transcript_2555/g.3466  ORF Transcript_2555/g.3466 Transcript_2555/m.3466 type:complete len:143 (+) Transcript_2555:576-1004(+)